MAEKKLISNKLKRFLKQADLFQEKDMAVW